MPARQLHLAEVVVCQRKAASFHAFFLCFPPSTACSLAHSACLEQELAGSSLVLSRGLELNEKVVRQHLGDLLLSLEENSASTLLNTQDEQQAEQTSKFDCSRGDD